MAKSNKQQITVTISPQAKEDILKILDYLKQEWGQKVVNEFLQKLDVFYQIILINPRLFSFHNKRKNIRKYALTKENVAYYRTKRKNVEIITVFDTRQNPKKIKKILPRS